MLIILSIFCNYTRKNIIYQFFIAEDILKKTCCFTGCTKISFGEYEGIAKRLRNKIIKLIENG